MHSLAGRYLRLFLISSAVVVLDQLTKSLLRGWLALGESWPAEGWLLGLFRIVRAENTGAAFSMGRGLGPVFLVLAVAACVGLLIYFRRLPANEPLLLVAAGLWLGGTLGNLIDRLTLGQVTDFLSIRFFAIVNVADISLTFGTIGVILWVLLQSRQGKDADEAGPV